MAQLRVGAFGKQDSYSYLAARAAFPKARLVPVPYTKDIFLELKRGRLDVAVVPIENTSGGWVEDVLFELIGLSSNDPKARVILEIDLPVVLCVAGVGTRQALRRFHRVYSHPYPLFHSSEWLDKFRPQAERVETASTSEAAERAARDPGSVALCNAAAARRLGLKVLMRDVPSRALNLTRFVAVGRHDHAVLGRRTRSCLWFSAANRPGSLVKVLEVFKRHGINLTRISSRSLDGFRSYRFFVEMDGDIGSPRMAPALRDLRAHASQMAVIGSYPVLRVNRRTVGRLSA